LVDPGMALGFQNTIATDGLISIVALPKRFTEEALELPVLREIASFSPRKSSAESRWAAAFLVGAFVAVQSSFGHISQRLHSVAADGSTIQNLAHLARDVFANNPALALGMFGVVAATLPIYFIVSRRKDYAANRCGWWVILIFMILSPITGGSPIYHDYQRTQAFHALVTARTSSLEDIRAGLFTTRDTQFNIRADVSNMALAEFIGSLGDFPVEVGLEVLEHDNRLYRIVTIGHNESTTVTIVWPPSVQEKFYFHTHPLGALIRQVGRQRAEQLRKIFVYLPSRQDFTSLKDNEVGYVQTQGMLFKYVRGKPISKHDTVAIVDGKQQILVPGSKDRSEDYNAARVEEAASPLISAGASHIVVVYPNGNTTSFDKNFHLVDLLNRAYPKGDNKLSFAWRSTYVYSSQIPPVFPYARFSSTLESNPFISSPGELSDFAFGESVQLLGKTIDLAQIEEVVFYVNRADPGWLDIGLVNAPANHPNLLAHVKLDGGFQEIHVRPGASHSGAELEGWTTSGFTFSFGTAQGNPRPLRMFIGTGDLIPKEPAAQNNGGNPNSVLQPADLLSPSGTQVAPAVWQKEKTANPLRALFRRKRIFRSFNAAA